MDDLVRYELNDRVATLRLDDGKVNVMSPAMQSAIHAGLDRSIRDEAVVLMTGRPGVFSAGFDLATLRGGGDGARHMVQGGFELSLRILDHPYPVVMACTGHAIAMGTFLLLSGDYRIGGDGDYSLAANEVAIGLTMPFAATEILRQRLTPSAFNRAVTIAATFGAHNAVEAGFLDEVVPADDLIETAKGVAAMSALLDLDAHAASKRRARRLSLDAIRAGLAADVEAFASWNSSPSRPTDERSQ